ncbi:hypothetical protein [uncultured Fibrella sp.]|uniref:hypothetical protein n=1 Tax=uncultured Fibrella sp. TaxID=1284596 RepID=UPI0035CC46B8
MNWVRYDSERIWNHLIGSGIPSYFQICYEDIDHNALNACLGPENPDFATVGGDYTTCINSSIIQVCYTYYPSTNGQSDGLIKAPSLSGYNTAWATNATRVEALGVNHLQMRKHPRMGTIYNEAFDNVYGPAFATPKR